MLLPLENILNKLGHTQRRMASKEIINTTITNSMLTTKHGGSKTRSKGLESPTIFTKTLGMLGMIINKSIIGPKIESINTEKRLTILSLSIKTVSSRASMQIITRTPDIIIRLLTLANLTNRPINLPVQLFFYHRYYSEGSSVG